MSIRILVIEDEESINDLICMNLEVAGYQPVPFLDGDEVSKSLLTDSAYDCALVDVMLPGKNGFELLPQLKSCGVPVIFLTAKGEVQDKVRGLREGAEDYIVKPFEMLELMVRIEKVLKRNGVSETVVKILDVEINTEKRMVTKRGEEVYLKPMEYECLLMFARHKNKALTRKQILGALWGMEFDGETRTVDAHVGRIRKKLDWGNVIKTIPTIGYRLEVDE